MPIAGQKIEQIIFLFIFTSCQNGQSVTNFSLRSYPYTTTFDCLACGEGEGDVPGGDERGGGGVKNP
jgi:hypothetical protein